MRVLYLTNNPNLGSTIRVAMAWMLQSRNDNLYTSYVGIQAKGPLYQWLNEHHIPNEINRMSWMDKWRPWQCITDVNKMVAWARAHKIDVIHCQEHNVYPFGYRVARKLGVPVICTVQFKVDRGFSEWAFGGHREPDRLVWTSQAQKTDCVSAISGLVPEPKQTVIPLGLNVDQFRAALGNREDIRRGWGAVPGELLIGTASAIRPRKRIEDFVRLIIELSKECPNIRGVIAGAAPQGDEAYEASLRKVSEEAKLNRPLIWLGNLDQIEPFMNGIDLFVSTSVYETFGMSVCEAMTAGRPVVGYVGGSIGEVVGDTGPIVSNQDYEALYDSIKKMVNHPIDLERKGVQALSRVRTHYDSRVSLHQINKLYVQVTEG